MAEKISLYGLSRSGKSCFIYAMSQALSQGIELADGEIMNVITPDPRQMLRLYNAYDGMINGSWPKGTDKSFVYNFNVLKSLALLTTIDVEDYRGGLLQDLDEDAQEEQVRKAFSDKCRPQLYEIRETALAASLIFL